MEQAARAELIGHGRPDLAEQVVRVSLISDELGFDVDAPRLDGSARRLEVKTTTLRTSEAAETVFVSRNEAQRGAGNLDWSLVLCRVDVAGTSEGKIVGWWPFAALREHLPTDSAASEWQSTRLRLPAPIGTGLPPAIP